MYCTRLAARAKSGFLSCLFACLLAAPVAASNEGEASGQLLGQPLLSSACERPDLATISAILPVRTDHGSFASGIVVERNRVLTAAHAIQGGGHFFVRIGGTYRSADLVMVDHVEDLAVLSVNTLNLVPLRINQNSLPLSEPVWAVGYPLDKAKTASPGTFQRFVGNVLHTSATIDPGQSGGGLLSCSQGRWSLAGMLRGYGAYWQGDQYVKLQNHSVSVAGTTISNFLQRF